MQNWSPPSFFQTKTTALHQGDCEGQMVLPSSISCRCSWTSSKRGGAILQNFSLKGSSSNSIMCSTASVHPISFLSSEKMSWYSINICSNFRANSGVHHANSSNPPSCFNSCISNRCLSLMESLGGADPGSCSSSFFIKSGVGFPSGITLAASTRAGDHPASREMHWFARKITKHHDYTPAAITQLRVSWYHVDTYREIRPVFNIRGLSYNIETVPHHHRPMISGLDNR